MLNPRKTEQGKNVYFYRPPYEDAQRKLSEDANIIGIDVTKLDFVLKWLTRELRTAARFLADYDVVCVLVNDIDLNAQDRAVGAYMRITGGWARSVLTWIDGRFQEVIVLRRCQLVGPA